ncbi:hypothetical protein [Mucilaginibacter kameinonensis]|uniref:hypothetical protein n=1 Tax=Mucilaginibacter kameinonensis TaxID=452286 RepID=UPI0013CE8E73|nr:hypothetical protein [Mucilaginibacter kameinonensis]
MKTQALQPTVSFNVKPITGFKIPAGFCMNMLVKLIRFIGSVNLATCKDDQFIF